MYGISRPRLFLNERRLFPTVTVGWLEEEDDSGSDPPFEGDNDQTQSNEDQGVSRQPYKRRLLFVIGRPQDYTTVV
jgi:hypothetical protein